MPLSIVIPTYGRDEVLTDSIAMLLAQSPAAAEIVVVDQTTDHAPATAELLGAWHREGAIRWIPHQPPGVVGAMHRGMQEARRGLVLFLDDDIIPASGLVAAHLEAHRAHADVWAVVGQVLQPWQSGPEDPPDEKPGRGLWYDLEFQFAGTHGRSVSNVIGCNLSVNRERFYEVGGFDANFVPPVSYRFETEFARRLVRSGGRIWFEPRASIRHLQSSRGGTRSSGMHFRSASPLFGVGDYYFALREGTTREAAVYSALRLFRQCRSRFHVTHPWWIPVKFVGELRALALALRLWRRGPRLLSQEGR